MEGGYCKEVCTVLFIDKTSESCVIIKIFSKIKKEGTRRKKYQEGYLSVFLISEKWGGGTQTLNIKSGVDILYLACRG